MPEEMQIQNPFHNSRIAYSKPRDLSPSHLQRSMEVNLSFWQVNHEKRMEEYRISGSASHQYKKHREFKKACLSINGWQFDSSIHSWWDIFDSFTTGDGVGLTDEQESQKGSMRPLELPLPSRHLWWSLSKLMISNETLSFYSPVCSNNCKIPWL